MKPKPLYLERLLQINTATLAALGALLLGMGQRDDKLPLLMLIASVASVVLTDVLGYVRLHRAVGNLAVLAGVALFASSTAYTRAEIGVLLPNVGTFLTFWLIVLLFQKKDQRAYRHLIMLSLLQVIVATVFSHGVWFGLLLVVYMVVGFSALALLLLHTQWAWYRTLQRQQATRSFFSALALLLHTQWARYRTPQRQQATGGFSQRRLPPSDPPTAFVGMPTGRNNLGAGRELLLRLGIMALGTLLLTVLLFVALPRFGRPAWRGTTVRTRHVVGFSDTMALGEIGTIIESREEVMRLRLSDAKTGLPYRHAGSLYLRGAVWNQYHRRQWEHRPTAMRSVVPVAEDDVTVRQTIEIEPLDEDALFCVWPFGLLDSRAGERVQIAQETERICRPPIFRDRRFTYELGTTGLSGGVQAELVPSSRLPDIDDFQQLLQLPDGPCRRALEETWSSEDFPSGENRIQLAKALTAKFHDPERFQYSLDPQQRQSDDPNVDPVVDFLQNNPRGHCEYFASALALLLRSRNIPARVVVGYHCDEFDEAGRFWQVRQLHAHAWVEAYIRPRDVPGQLIARDGTEHWKQGGWLRLEPTPGMETPAASRDPSFFQPVENGWHWLQDIWSDYVVEMNRQRQQDAIYGPIIRAVKHAFYCVIDLDWWRGLMWAAIDVLNVAKGGLRWLWAGIALLVGVPVTIYVGRRVGRVVRWFWRRVIGRAGPDDRGGPAGVQFYRRLEVLLARQGMTRGAGQTQHEFAAAAGVQIAAATGRSQLASLPVHVAEAFYQVRFGRLPLDSDQAQAVEDALDELAVCGEEGVGRD